MIHYPHLLAFKTAQPVADAIADLARRDCLTIPEVCRRLILAGLRENGMDPAQTRHDRADQAAA
jgi:hypothetical protein